MFLLKDSHQKNVNFGSLAFKWHTKILQLRGRCLHGIQCCLLPFHYAKFEMSSLEKSYTNKQELMGLGITTWRFTLNFAHRCTFTILRQPQSFRLESFNDFRMHIYPLMNYKKPADYTALTFSTAVKFSTWATVMLIIAHSILPNFRYEENTNFRIQTVRKIQLVLNEHFQK